ncbi:MAG: hypothetical protein RLZZ450_4584 [Pseudomonadota bacterium]|jgi:hypothetical protein
MRIDLGQLSVQGLLLELPGSQTAPQDKRVRIDSAEQLRGVFVQTAAGFQLSNVVCPRLVLSKLDWLFGTLGLRADQAAQLTGLVVEAGTTSGELELELRLSGLAATLELSVGNLRIVAQVEGQGVLLQSGPAVGLLRAEHAVFSALQVRTASFSVALPSLKVEGLLVDWSGDDFRLEASKLEGGELTLEQAGTKLRGTGLKVAGLRVLGASVQAAQASLARLDVAAELPAPAPVDSSLERATPASGDEAAPAIFDYELLNGLAGYLNVDVAVDLAVPIIGRRRATHELRIALEDGALDYRELENNLARLEDSLLDFSVRDGALVLERGLPLISTRGRGKPIVIWDLRADDLALAEDRRVRLAVLPKARLAASSGQSEPPPPPDPQEESSSAFRLRHLSLQDIDAALRLASTGSGQGALRELTFASLTVQGTVHHDPEGPKREGRIRAALSDLRTTLTALPLGTQQVGTAVEVASVRDIDVTFEDVRPRRASAVFEGIVLRSLSLTS